MPAHVAEVVLVKDNKVLLVQQKKESAKGLWSYPGGRVENDESLENAVIRELQEELGVKLHNPKIFKQYSIVTSFGPLIITIFTGTIGNQTITLNTDELLAYEWFSLPELESMAGALRGEIELIQAKEVLAKTTVQG